MVRVESAIFSMGIGLAVHAEVLSPYTLILTPRPARMNNRISMNYETIQYTFIPYRIYSRIIKL